MVITQAQFNNLIDALLDAVAAKNQLALLTVDQQAEIKLAEAKFRAALHAFENRVQEAGGPVSADCHMLSPVLHETLIFKIEANVSIESNKPLKSNKSFCYHSVDAWQADITLYENREGIKDSNRLMSQPRLIHGHDKLTLTYRVSIEQIYEALTDLYPDQAEKIASFVYQGRYQPVDSLHPREFLIEGVSETRVEDHALNASFLMKVLAHPVTPIIGALLLLAGIALICLGALSLITLAPAVAIGVGAGMAIGGAALFGGFFAARSNCCHRQTGDEACAPPPSKKVVKHVRFDLTPLTDSSLSSVEASANASSVPVDDSTHPSRPFSRKHSSSTSHLNRLGLDNSHEEPSELAQEHTYAEPSELARAHMACY